MKLNFEKGIVGAAIVVESLAPSQAKGQERAKDIFLNQNEIKSDPSLEKYRIDYLNYMNHPSYKQHLAKEMFGDEEIDADIQEKIDKEYQIRIEKVKNVPMNYVAVNDSTGESGAYSPENNTIITSDTSAYHELSHSSDGINVSLLGMGDKITEKGFANIKNSIMGTQDEMWKKFENSEVCKNGMAASRRISENLWNEIKNEYSKSEAHKFKMTGSEEYNTDITTEEGEKFVKDIVLHRKPESTIKNINNPSFIKNHKLTNKEDYILYEKMQNEANKADLNIYYFDSNTEIKARINSLRLKAYKYFGYDLKTEFDINKYPELKKDHGYIQLKDNSELSDKNINELSKYIAMDTEQIDQTDTYYHPGWDYDDKNNIT